MSVQSWPHQKRSCFPVNHKPWTSPENSTAANSPSYISVSRLITAENTFWHSGKGSSYFRLWLNDWCPSPWKNDVLSSIRSHSLIRSGCCSMVTEETTHWLHTLCHLLNIITFHLWFLSFSILTFAVIYHVLGTIGCMCVCLLVWVCMCVFHPDAIWCNLFTVFSFMSQILEPFFITLHMNIPPASSARCKINTRQTALLWIWEYGDVEQGQ